MNSVDISTERWKINDIKGVLFDKDGTLLNSHVYWGEIIKRRANAVISTYSLDPHMFEEICRAMGYNILTNKLLPEGPIGLVSRENVIQHLVSYFISKNIILSFANVDTIFKAEHQKFLEDANNFIEILPGVRATLENLKLAGVKIAVVTSDTEINTETFVNKYGLEKHIDLIVGKDSVNSPKITGLPAIHAINSLSLERKNVVCMGDAPMDLIMAKNSNTYGIGIATGQVGEDLLRKHTSYTANTMVELAIRKN